MASDTEVFKTATVEHGGKVYTIARASFAVRMAFAKFLETRAIEFVRRQAAILGPDGYGEALRGITRDAAAGVYAWGGRVMNDAIRNDDDALQEAIFITLAQRHEDLLRETFAKLWEAKGAELATKFFEVQSPPANPQTPPPAAA